MGRLQRQAMKIKTPLRRVFFKRDQYICGMCRRSFDEKNNAERCLRSCSQQFAAQVGIAIVRHLGTPHFKCRYCRRVFREYGQAQQCVQNCVPDYWDKVGEVEFEVEPPKQKPRKKYVPKPEKIKIDPIPPYKLRNMITDEELDKEIDATLSSSDEDKEAEEAEAARRAAEEKKKRVKVKADLPDQFIRQGAQYQCTYCMELYYTKIEVLKCFEEHPDELPEDKQDD